MINVTKTFLPPIEEFKEILNRSWEKKWITNRGDLIIELENKLSKYLKASNFFITTNGTLPLQIALKSLEITKEVITTPFSYVATTSAIVWENCTPVFVDIDEDSLTIDANKIEAAITENTQAILATHVFGNPCDVEALAAIAKKHNLKIIYDAAHCFGVTYKGESVFNYGDISTTSFHATKLFHTGEGGAIFVSDQALYNKVFYHHNFGHDGPLKFHGIGINAKASELQAAMGLSILPYMDNIIAKRKKISLQYETLLQNNNKIRLLSYREGAQRNYSYMPIIFKNEKALEATLVKLNTEDIFPRRYFSPSLNTLPYLSPKVSMPISEKISSKVLCLPLYYELEEKQIEQFCNIINAH